MREFAAGQRRMKSGYSNQDLLSRVREGAAYGPPHRLSIIAYLIMMEQSPDRHFSVE